MNDVKIKFDNLMAGVEYIQANSTAEIVTVSSLEYGTGIEMSFIDKNNKHCVITVFAGPTTPEVKQISKIYRSKH